MALTGSKGQENLITFLFFALFLAFLWRPKTFPILKPHIGNNFPIPINFIFNYLISARLCHVYIHVNSANHTSAKRYRRITIRNITDLVPIFTWTSAQEGSEASAMPATQELQEISVGVKQLMDPEATYLNKSADWQNQLICQSADLSISWFDPSEVSSDPCGLSHATYLLAVLSGCSRRYWLIYFLCSVVPFEFALVMLKFNML